MIKLKAIRPILIIALLVAAFACNALMPGAVLGVETAKVKASVNIKINNNLIVFSPNDQAPEVVEQRTYVPIRIISENLGAKVVWKQDSQQVVINRLTTSNISLPAAKPGEIQIIIDGQVLSIPANYGKAYVTNNRVMIPLSYVSQALGCQVNWVQNSMTVDIKSAPVQGSNTSQIKPVPVSADNQLLQNLAQYRSNLKLTDGSVISSEKLLSTDASAFSAEQMAVFRTYWEQLKTYPQTVTIPGGIALNTGDLSIMGNSYLSAEQLKKWIAGETPRIKANMAAAGVQFKAIPELADLYIKIGAEYGIRGDIAFCQAAKETGYWQYQGDVQAGQNNYCGLWATGSPLSGDESLNGADKTRVRFEAGLHGATFASPAAGVEAHIQHLYAYATKNPLPTGKVLVDPRFILVNRGIAPTWLKLSARWAVPGTTYGQSIISNYWIKAF